MDTAAQLTRSPQDTIVACATAPGSGAVAIARCSGPLAAVVLERCFRPFSKTPLESHRMALGRWRDPASGAATDTVLAVRMDAPRSFTGETVVEVHCHGGTAVVEAVVDTFVTCGARLAQPGEFTRRAFLNGKFDLAQAEAIADLVQAATWRAQQTALRQLDGALSRKVEQLRARLIAVIAEFEAYLDFPDEDLPTADGARLFAELDTLRDALRRLVAQGRRGRLFRDGARVAIAGPPNAGKSSLFNALVGRERSIVSPHPGTTRDTIECTIDLDGVAVTLVDTAGLREADVGEVERLGIERTARELRQADVAVWLCDVTDPHAPPQPPTECGPVWLRVGAKIDLAPADTRAALTRPVEPSGTAPFDCLISSVTGEGVEALERLLAGRLLGATGAGGDEETLVSNRRHVDLFASAADALERGLKTLRAGDSPEFAIVDLRTALAGLGDVIGREVGDAVLDAIFSRFCIGK